MKNNNKSTFSTDLSFEKYANEQMIRAGVFEHYRVTEIVDFSKNPEKQYQGIDIYFLGDDGQIHSCDIKAVACNLPTFAMEIQGRHDTNEIGWLFNPEKQNEYYLFAWLIFENGKGYDYNKYHLDTEHVSYIETVLIKKETLKNEIGKMLNQYGWKLEDLPALCKTFRDFKPVTDKMPPERRESANAVPDKIKHFQIFANSTVKEKNATDYIKKLKNNSGWWLSVSMFIQEQPVNMVIKKNLLKQMAEKELYTNSEYSNQKMQEKRQQMQSAWNSYETEEEKEIKRQRDAILLQNKVILLQQNGTPAMA